MKITGNPRASAVTLLLRCEKQGSYANLALDAYLDKSGMSDADKRLLTALVYGVMERKITFDHLLSALSSRKDDSVDIRVRYILYTAFYQLMYMDRIPAHAVVNEAVEYGKQLCGPAASTFINAILRSLLRKGTDLSLYTDSLQDDAYLSVLYSVPVWLVRLWRESYGAKSTEKILKATLEKPRLTLCVNTVKTSVDSFVNSLNAAGIHPKKVGPTALVLPSVSLKHLPGFDEGLFYVQDLSCQQAVEALAPEKGDTVIDLCSAPGGKAFKSALLMQNEGIIHVSDIHDNRLRVVTEGAKRLGIDIISAKSCDARTLRTEFIQSADCVICDVPCSGLGVLAKKSDIRNKKDIDIVNLPAIQSSILETASNYVKPGGRLMYATCTLHPAENEWVTNAFLKKHPEFSRVSPGPNTVFPDDTHDGFFYDILTKRT